MIAPPVAPAYLSLITGIILILFSILLYKDWITVTEEQKTQIRGVYQWVAGVFALATAANLYFQLKPDSVKRTLVQSASSTV